MRFKSSKKEYEEIEKLSSIHEHKLINERLKKRLENNKQTKENNEPEINNSQYELDEKYQKRNLKLYAIYKMLSFDLLFYYIVSFLFLTEVKGFSPSKILFVEAFYPLFKLFAEATLIHFIDKQPKKICLIVANFSLVISMLIFLSTTSEFLHIISNLFMAIGFTIKDQVESTITYDFISEKNHKEKRTLFLKIDGKSTSKYHILNAITSLISSSLYIISPYLPFICTATTLLISTIICFFFKIFESHKEERKTQTRKEYLKELKESFNFINKSQRLTCLLIFNALFHGLISFMVAYKSSLLTDINTSTAVRGLLFALFSIAAYGATKKTHKFQGRFKNKTLTVFSMSYLLFMMIIGLAGFPNKVGGIGLFLIFISMTLMSFIETPYRTIINQYLNNFTVPKISTKIFWISGTVAQLFSLIYMLLASLLLEHFKTAVCFVIISAISFIIFIILLEKMKSKVGLKPEEYKESEIYIK